MGPDPQSDWWTFTPENLCFISTERTQTEKRQKMRQGADLTAPDLLKCTEITHYVQNDIP